jgi:hypothetical protein
MSLGHKAAKALAKLGKGATAAVARLRALKEQNTPEVSSSATAALEAIERTAKPQGSASKAG